MSRNAKQNGYGKTVPIDSAAIGNTAWGVWCALSTFAKWETEHGQPVRSKPDTCIPRVEVIAVRAHLSSVRAVQNAIKELVAAGYVRVCPRFGRKSKGQKGEQRSNGYMLYPRGDAPISEEERESRRQYGLKKLAEINAMLAGGAEGKSDTPPEIAKK